MKNSRNTDKPGTAPSRRDFLKFCGYSFAVTALTSCHSKIEKAIPYIVAPVEITPGEATYYASSYINGNDYCSIVVKCRDGRPIKIEGNPESEITMGGTSARVQASVLDLYDMSRYHGPLKEGSPIAWENSDEEITGRLQKIAGEGGAAVLLTPSIYSPSTEAVIADFLRKYPGSEWIRYDAISHSAMLEANNISFGKQVIPDYRFDKADLVVSMNADFLGTWLSPVEYTKRFSSGRDPDGNMNCLIQLESNLSLTGCNADKRYQIKPSQEYVILMNIYREIVRSLENRSIDTPDSPVDVGELSGRLMKLRGKSLVISSSDDTKVQLLVNEINRLLGNIGNTIQFGPYLRTHRAPDHNMEMLVKRMQEGKINALLMWNVNPVYTWHDRKAIEEGLAKVGLTVSFSGSSDETSSLTQYVCPDNHYLESWNDVEAKKNRYSLMQPVIGPVYDTRQFADTLLKWSGSDLSFYDFIKSYWTDNLMHLQTEFTDPRAFFNNTLQKGVFEPGISGSEGTVNVTAPASYNFELPATDIETRTNDGTIEVVLYESVALGEGRQANNPWLQELPDPVTRICWDNFASISPLQAGESDLQDGDIINLAGIDLPVIIQPGQCYGTIGIALGYGRTVCGKVGKGIGVDVWQLRSVKNGIVVNIMKPDEIIKTSKTYSFAQVQTHHVMEGRPLVREAGLKEYRENPAAGNELHAENASHLKGLYKERDYPNLHWGMAIDLSKCTGCASCVIACVAENNIPVVGKIGVAQVREMQWIRIDRYYNGDDENPEVVFQPVLCQHCDNAPCENVCPVAATNHSSEGLNQMIYNRCVGTRYCNNNCPYKVRRFNFFNYTEAGTLSGNLRDRAGMTGDLRRMVLNPDVTIRSQGVIEKCSFCIQRIQASKLKAKKENRALKENEIQTACSQACPANAIVFGDMNNPKSEISRLIGSGRRYNLLEELYTKPSVNYLTKIRNEIS